MILSVLLLIVGLALILYGANIMIDGASAIARRFGLSDLVIGLTIVAFGTSAPELVISIVSSMEGSGALAIGNVAGSNIFNILMIVGCTAAISPISVDSGSLKRDIPFTLLASLVLFFCASDRLIDGATADVVSRGDGLLLICFFIIFLRYTFGMAKESPEENHGSDSKPSMALWKAIGLTLAGLAGLVFGGDWFVDGASGIARGLGVSEAVIGLTIVAAGTSLPELATSVAAALKNRPGMAIGNVVGSCLFNIFMVLGAAALVRPISADAITGLDYSMLIGSALLLLLFGFFFGQRKITRWEGIVMCLIYIGYTAYLVAGANG